MNDKYYILSIIVIFLALGIGILAGITINENDIFNEEQQCLIKNLELEFSVLREKNKIYKQEITNLNSNLDEIKNLLEINFEYIFKDRLQGRKIVLLGINELVLDKILMERLKISGVEILAEEIIEDECLAPQIIDAISMTEYITQKPDCLIILMNDMSEINPERYLCFLKKLVSEGFQVVCIENNKALQNECKKLKINTLGYLDSIFDHFSLFLLLENY